MLGQIWFQNCNVTDFYEMWHSEQIEHAKIETHFSFGSRSSIPINIFIMMILTQNYRFRQIWFQN